jgi:hypothetical protein
MDQRITDSAVEIVGYFIGFCDVEGTDEYKQVIDILEKAFGTQETKSELEPDGRTYERNT